MADEEGQSALSVRDEAACDQNTCTLFIRLVAGPAIPIFALAAALVW